MKIKSITSASGWFRIVGRREDAYTLEKLAVFAVIESEPGKSNSDDIVVGIPAIDLGVSGNEENQFLKDVAGYVEVNETKIDPLGNRVLTPKAAERIDWEV